MWAGSMKFSTSTSISSLYSMYDEDLPVPLEGSKSFSNAITLGSLPVAAASSVMVEMLTAVDAREAARMRVLCEISFRTKSTFDSTCSLIILFSKNPMIIFIISRDKGLHTEVHSKLSRSQVTPFFASVLMTEK